MFFWIQLEEWQWKKIFFSVTTPWVDYEVQVSLQGKPVEYTFRVANCPGGANSWWYFPLLTEIAGFVNQGHLEIQISLSRRIG